jgi:5-oxoprolinase (ATP-hydrolysing)
MANAIKAVSLRRGQDVTRAALVCFGGAAGQHACRVADALGISTVQCHPLASVLSAYGMGLADRRVLREATLALPLDEGGIGQIEAAVARLGQEAQGELAGQGIGKAAIRRETSLGIRPVGSENAIDVPYGSLEAMRSAFRDGWQTRFGFAAGEALIAETLRVEAIAAGDEASGSTVVLPGQSSAPGEDVTIFTGGQARRVPLYLRETLAAGFTA